MPTILVVDDSTVDRRLAGRLLEKQLGVTVSYAKDGKAAVKAIEKEPPDLVLTDMHMPQMNGLELVEHIRAHHSRIPVVLMTAYGSDEIAAQALKNGAASYVPKRLLAEELAGTVRSLLAIARADRTQDQFLDCLTQAESQFVLHNDPALIPALIGHVETGLQHLKLCDGTGLIRVTVALREAVQGAMDANLEVSSALREQDQARYQQLMTEHAAQEPYNSRHVHVLTRATRARALFTVRHDGPGSGAAALPDIDDPANLESVSCRGLLLIRTFMDDVYYEDAGRALTMIKQNDFSGRSA